MLKMNYHFGHNSDMMLLGWFNINIKILNINNEILNSKIEIILLFKQLRVNNSY